MDYSSIIHILHSMAKICSGPWRLSVTLSTPRGHHWVTKSSWGSPESTGKVTFKTAHFTFIQANNSS
ncbi:hypothetical protein HJC23_002114 [Cyclotella cryptica]|uniref:Uncharacterized protein n=1 Tax=Cyclotella cryptica TaxID=29204 RepID=A0ABD3Q1L9_9STRA